MNRNSFRILVLVLSSVVFYANSASAQTAPVPTPMPAEGEEVVLVGRSSEPLVLMPKDRLRFSYSQEIVSLNTTDANTQNVQDGIYKDGSDFNGIGFGIRVSAKKGRFLNVEAKSQYGRYGSPYKWSSINGDRTPINETFAPGNFVKRSATTTTVEITNRHLLNSFVSVDYGALRHTFKTRHSYGSDYNPHVQSAENSLTRMVNTYTGPMGGFTAQHEIGRLDFSGQGRAWFLIENGTFEHEYRSISTGKSGYVRPGRTVAYAAEFGGRINFRLTKAAYFTGSYSWRSVGTQRGNFRFPDSDVRFSHGLNHNLYTFGMTFRS